MIVIKTVERKFLLMLKTLGKRSKDFFIDSKIFYLSLYKESYYTGVTNENIDCNLSGIKLYISVVTS